MNSAARNWLLALVALIGTVATALAGDRRPVPPDLTREKQADRELTYNLGATGLRGWIYTRPANAFESYQGRTTAAARQILVSHVGAKSPADGVMRVDDVILGVNGKPFDDDARKSFAIAIQEAEKDSNHGILNVLRWRDGKTEQVQLKLAVMGTYADTAPYNCPKSAKILDAACQALEKEPLPENLWGGVDCLALMASGKPQYMSKVRDFAHKLSAISLKDHDLVMGTWEAGYRNVFFCEYYLITKDREVLPAISALTIGLARGQSLYGTFGHKTVDPTPDGKLHGSVPPYGPVNATGLIANLAIVMGKKCGVNDREVDAAIDRAVRFFGYYTDKGAIPYGEHLPWPYHDNNGKNAMTAILFAMQGARPADAHFFAKMVTASYENRQYGHTGQGFSYLWGALGANVGGPDAVAAFFKESSWHFDLERRCDGSFVYDGGEQYGPGKTDDNTYYGKSSYNGLSPNASYILTYALPLRKLLITGREGTPSNWLSKKDVAEAIASGRFDIDRKSKNVRELIMALDDWSPVVRGWAAEELAHRSEAKSIVPELLHLADSPDAHLRQGACETLGDMKSAEALPVLVRRLSDPDRWVRVKAATALKDMGDIAKPVIPDMLRVVAQTAEPAQPISWEDPVQLAQGELAAALFDPRTGLLRGGIKGIDRGLLFPAIRAISRNADGMARSTLKHVFENQLTEEDVRALGPDILAAVRTRGPADTMFGNEIRMGAFKALVKYRFKEGIDAAVIFAKTQGGHGSQKRTPEILEALATYGPAAKSVIPQLKELIAQFDDEVRHGKFPGGQLNKERTDAVEQAIQSIESATTQPPLKSLDQK